MELLIKLIQDYLIFITGISFFSISLNSLLSDLKIKNNGIKVSAKVVEIMQKKSNSLGADDFGINYYLYTLEFLDNDNNLKIVKSEIGLTEKYKIGKTFEILYNKNNPNEIIDLTHNQIEFNYIFIFIGIISMLISYWLEF